MTQQQLGRKVAILSTSDIMTRDNHGNFRSTGLLEHAQDVMELRVIIVSTREKTFEHDTWWILRVDKEDIYMSPPVENSFSSFGPETYDVAYRRSYRHAWRPLLKKLGWDYPPCEFDPERERDHNQMVFWASHNLKTLHRHNIDDHYSEWLKNEMKFYIKVRYPDNPHESKSIRFVSLWSMIDALKEDWVIADEITIFARNEVTVDVLEMHGFQGKTIHTRETFTITNGLDWSGTTEEEKFCEELANFFDSEIRYKYRGSKNIISITALTDIDETPFCTTVVTNIGGGTTSVTELQ